MRVLHVTSSFPRSEEDHVAPFLLDLVRTQADAGIDVTVVAPHDAGVPTVGRVGGVLVERFRYAPTRLERLAYRGGLLNRVRTISGVAVLPLFFGAFARATAAAVRRHRPDVIHAHWWLPAALCALPARARHRVPLVVTLHGSDVHILRRRIVRRVARWVLERADVVAVVSEQLRVQVAQYFDWPADRLTLLRLPLGTPLDPTPLPGNSPPRVLAAGRLSWEKGFDVLVDAVELLANDGVNLQVDLIGSGPKETELATRARPLGDRIRMQPAVPRQALWALMDACDALVVPSRREGLGLIALEALARGRPVVASRTGGLPEVVGDGDGLLVAPGDATALAQALRRLPLPAPQASSARRHAPQVVVEAHLAAYASCADPHPEPVRTSN